MNLANLINVLVENGAGQQTGYTYIAIGICCLSMGFAGIGEGLIGYKTVESMSRNPEMYGKLRTAMIICCAVTETTAIYALLLSILMLFVA